MPDPTPESLICPGCGGTGKTNGGSDWLIGQLLWQERRQASVSVNRMVEALGRSVFYVEELESGRVRFTASIVADYRAAITKAKEVPHA